MKVQFEQIRTDDKFHVKCSGFVDSEFVQTCDELVKGYHQKTFSSSGFGHH